MNAAANRRRTDGRRPILRAAAAACGLAFALVAGTRDASAQALGVPPPSILSYAYSYTVTADSESAGIHTFTRAFSPKWSASYGLAPSDQTALTWSYLRYDQTLGYARRGDGGAKDRWRHFLGIQYAPFEGVSLLGGIAKSGGIAGLKGSGASPTGYERLRLSTGARWLGEDWSVDGTFSFIPGGASRVPNDAAFFPSDAGDPGSTYFFAVTVSRRF